MKNKILLTALIACTMLFSTSHAFSKKPKIISGKLLSITMPYETRGLYKIKKNNTGILVFDKKSKRKGFGGFAFAIRTAKSPSDWAMIPGNRKIGELYDKNNNLYDVLLNQPTDVQYDYVNNDNKEYNILYKLADTVEIYGANGSRYYPLQGMLGKNLYSEIIDKHIKAINEKWDSARLEKENMSYMYNVLAKSGYDVLNKTGYAYYDVNGDGIEELFIGEITNDNYKGIIYDIYTMVNRTPKHVASGGNRDRYFVCDDYFLCNEYISGALENGWLVYNLVENSNELFPQVGFKYDAYSNKNNPWFISYDFANNKWENVSKKQFDDRKTVFNDYKRFEYIPFSSK